MRWTLEPVSGPEIEPVTLAEMKTHLGEFDDIDERDDEIEALITTAREWVEDFTGRALIDQSWRLTVGDVASVDTVTRPRCYCGTSEVEGTEIFLRRSPALEIVSFVSVDAEGDETAVDVANYELVEADGKWPRIVTRNGANFGSGVYRVTFRAGYANRDVSPAEGASVVPRRLITAIKLHAEAIYDRDREMMDRLMAAAALIATPEKTGTGFA